MANFSESRTPESRTPGTNLANLLEAQELESADRLSHKKQRLERFKSRIVNLAMAGRNRALLLRQVPA